MPTEQVSAGKQPLLERVWDVTDTGLQVSSSEALVEVHMSIARFSAEDQHVEEAAWRHLTPGGRLKTVLFNICACVSLMPCSQSV